MIASNKIFRLLIITIIGLTSSYLLIKSVDHKFAFDLFLLSIVSLVSIIIFVWTIYQDWKAHLKSKSKLEFIPTISGITILLGLSMTFYILDLRDKSISKLYCVTKMVDFNGASIDFREDGSYKLTSWCLGADYYRGKYTMKDSIITLDKTEIEKIIESNRLVIRSEIKILGNDSIPGNDTVCQKSVYQIDKHGFIIYGAIDFIVIDKNR